MSGACKTAYLNLKDFENANEKSVHQKCIEFLLIEVFKYLNGLSPDIMKTVFKLRQNTCNLRNFHAFESPRTKKFGQDSMHTELVSFRKMFPK